MRNTLLLAAMAAVLSAAWPTSSVALQRGTGAHAATPGPGAPVAAGSVEEELGRSVAEAILTTDTAARTAFASDRIGPRFMEMLGGPEAAAGALADLHAQMRGGALRSVRQGPNGSIFVILADPEGREHRLHVLRGIDMPDGRLKAGGWAIVP